MRIVAVGGPSPVHQGAATASRGARVQRLVASGCRLLDGRDFMMDRIRKSWTGLRLRGWALVLAVLCVPSLAAAKGVFLNGVNIDGVTGQTFENVTVVIDESGNVLITAKGYEVQTAPVAAQPKATTGSGPVSRRYFLVSETNMPGMVQYDVDVFINSVWIKRISHEDPQTVIEVTQHLKKGKNVIHMTAAKNLGESRRSASPQHYMKVIVGEGDMGGNNVMIDNPVLEYTRTAAESQNFADDFAVMGR